MAALLCLVIATMKAHSVNSDMANSKWLFLSKRRLFGLFVYGLAGLIVPYLLLFGGPVPIPKSVNSGSAIWWPFALSIDVFLLLQFALQHSMMARQNIKEKIIKLTSPEMERSCYVLASCVSLIVIFVFWQPIPHVLWDFQIGQGLMHALFLIGFISVYIAAFALNHLVLLGLKQAWSGAPQLPNKELRVEGVYRIVRHPLMIGLLLVFWATPQMTIGHFLFSIGMTLYIVIGTLLEEHDLVKEFGASYSEYQNKTPMFFPRIRQLWAWIDRVTRTY